MSLWSWMREREKAGQDPRRFRESVEAVALYDGAEPDRPIVPMINAQPACMKLIVQKEWRLIDLQTRETLVYGQKVAILPHGHLGTVEFGLPPTSESEEGIVYFRAQGAGYLRHVPPTDIGAKWCNGNELV